jgi:hypothetical protein
MHQTLDDALIEAIRAHDYPPIGYEAFVVVVRLLYSTKGGGRSELSPFSSPKTAGALTVNVSCTLNWNSIPSARQRPAAQ